MCCCYVVSDSGIPATQIPRRVGTILLIYLDGILDIEVKLHLYVDLLYLEGQSLNLDWSLDPDPPFGKPDRKCLNLRFCLGFV